MFKALASETRRKMLKILSKEDMHITGLARELGISVPVAAKHVKVLEEAGLLERTRFGRTHVLKARPERLKAETIYQDLDIFSEVHEVEVWEGANVLDVLRKVSGVEIEKVGKKEFITSVDGEKGYYIYEVDGKLPEKPMDECMIGQGTTVRLKRLVPVNSKEMKIRFRP